MVGEWRLSALTLLAVCLGVLPGSQSAGTERRLGDSYAVSQAYKLLVHDSGNVDVVMQIDFHLDPGARLSGSYKSILSDTSIQSIEADPEHPGGRVIATDGAGRSLDVTTTDQDGWIRVDFTFPEVVDGAPDSLVGSGTTTPTYTIKLAYTVVNGICMRSLRFRHIGLPWAHAWAVSVLESKYNIGFVNPNMEPIMDTVCFGALGFSLKCGHEPLSITGRQASYQASGLPHGVFFEWSGASSNSDDRQCTGQEASGLDLGLGKSADAEGIPGQAKHANIALIVGMVSIGASCLFAVLVCTFALKLPSRTGLKKLKLSGSSSTCSTYDGSMMTLSDEADTDSGGGGSASSEKAERRPKPLSMDIITNKDNFQLQRRGSDGSYLGSDPEAPAEPYRTGALDLQEHAEEHDSGGGVRIGGDGGSLEDWDVENEFPQQATENEKFARPADSVAFSQAQQGALGIRQLCNAPPSMPPPVPESRLRSHGTVGQFLFPDGPGVAEDDWQAMSEFDVEDDIERGGMMQTSGQVITLNGAIAVDFARGSSDPQMSPMHNSMIPMQESFTDMFTSHATIDAHPALEDSMWEAIDEFSDTASRCNESLKFSL